MSENDGLDTIFQLKCWHHIMLSAALFACEFGVTFQFIYSVTVLKLLGVPDAYVSLFGVISATACLLVLPFMGKYSDRGNKFRRKCLLVSGSGCLMISSAVFLLSATFLKLVHGGDTLHRAKNCSTINVTTSHSSSFVLKEILGNNDSEDIVLRGSIEDNLTLNILCKASFRDHSDVSDGEPQTSIISPILGVLAFALMDISIDTGYTNLRAFIVESVHPFWRGKVLSTSAIMSSFGGCAASVLGLLDYRPLFGQDKSPGLWKTIFLSLLFIISALVTFTITLLTGRYLRHTFSGERFTGVQNNISEGAILSPDLIRNAPKENETMDYKATENINCEHSCGTMEASCQTARWTPPLIIRNLKKIKLSYSFISLVLTCLLTFLSTGTVVTFQGYFSNFLAEGVYGGKADALEGSALRLKFEEGMEVGVNGAVCFEAAFLMYNLVQGAISRTLGIIQEYILVTVLVVPLLVATSVVKDMVLFYILAALCGVYRNNFIRTPYVLATECNEETVQLLVDTKTCALETSNINNEDGDSRSHGSNIAIVYATIPLLYLVTSAMMGPLLSATGNPAVPFYFSATSGVASCLVLFALAFIRRRQGLQ